MVGNGWTAWMMVTVCLGLGPDRAVAPAGGLPRADARIQPGVDDTSTVRIRTAAPGTWRFRYGMTLWTRPPVAVADLDPTAPAARLMLLVGESTDGARVLSREVAAADVDIPLLARLGGGGVAVRRALTRAFLAARDTTLPSSGPRPAAAGADGDDRWTPLADAVVSSLRPLGLMPPVPGRAVRAGDAWTDTVTVSVPGTLLEDPLRLAAELRLVAVREDGGLRTAVITQSARTRHAVLPDGSTVDLTLTAETVVDLDAGVPVRSTADLDARVRDPRGLAVPVRVRITARRMPSVAAGTAVASR